MKNNSPTRILFFISNDRYFLTHRYNLAKAAQAKGYDVHLLCRFEENSQALLAKEGITCHPLSHLNRGGMNPIHEIKTLLEIYQKFKQISPYILFAVAWKPVIYGTLVARILKTPQIIQALGGLGFTFTSPSLKARLIRLLLKCLIAPVIKAPQSKLILQNADNRSVLLNELGLDPDQITLIPGAGVDMNHFKPAEQKSFNPIPQIVKGARLLTSKGLAELARASQLLQEKGLSFQINLYGDLDLENPEGIQESQVKDWQSKGLLKWLGLCSDLAPILQQSDIAVLPSYSEGMPKFLLEAASCGLPCVTTDASGCRDVVVHNETGFLVPIQDAEALANSLQILIESEGLRHQFGREARKRIQTQFSDEIIHSKTLGLF